MIRYCSAQIRGIALVQVLVLSAILFAIVLSFTTSVRSQLVLAERVINYSETQLTQYTEQNRLLFSLLSVPWTEDKTSSDMFQQHWNFRGKSFSINNIHLQIQDVAGLIYIGSVVEDDFTSLAEKLWQDENRGRRLAASLNDWQDTDSLRRPNGAEQADYPTGKQVRNMRMQFEQELTELIDMTDEMYIQLADLITLYPFGAVNVMNMPDEIIEIRFNSEISQQLLRLRQQGRLTNAAMTALSGWQDGDFFSFMTGPAFRIRFTVNEGDVTLRSQITVVLNPYAAEPIQFWQSKRFSGTQRKYNDLEPD